MHVLTHAVRCAAAVARGAAEEEGAGERAGDQGWWPSAALLSFVLGTMQCVPDLLLFVVTCSLFSCQRSREKGWLLSGEKMKQRSRKPSVPSRVPLVLSPEPFIHTVLLTATRASTSTHWLGTPGAPQGVGVFGSLRSLLVG